MSQYHNSARKSEGRLSLYYGLYIIRVKQKCDSQTLVIRRGKWGLGAFAGCNITPDDYLGGTFSHFRYWSDLYLMAYYYVAGHTEYVGKLFHKENYTPLSVIFHLNYATQPDIPSSFLPQHGGKPSRIKLQLHLK